MIKGNEKKKKQTQIPAMVVMNDAKDQKVN